MKVINETDDDVYYQIFGDNQDYNCGSLAANEQSPDLTTFDNNQNVRAQISGTPVSTPTKPINVNIDSTGEGTAVTIRLSFE